MKSQWWIYVIVGVLAALAGFAIAGPPDSGSTTATIVVSVTTAEVSTTTTSTTTLPAPTTTAPPASTTTEAPTTDPPATEPAPTEPPATEPPPTEPPVTEPATTVAPTTTVPLVAREEMLVVVANGAEIGGIAGRVSGELRDLGYGEVLATDGRELVDDTRIYFQEGREREAERLADDLARPDVVIAPLAEAPDVVGSIADVDILVYLGRDYDD